MPEEQLVRNVMNCLSIHHDLFVLQIFSGAARVIRSQLQQDREARMHGIHWKD